MQDALPIVVVAVVLVAGVVGLAMLLSSRDAYERIGRSSLTLGISASRSSEPVLQARLVMVTTSLETHTSIALPEDLRAAVERYQENCQ